MIREEGRVIDYKNGLVKVQIDAKPSCHSCKLCSREKEGMTMEVNVDLDFSRGDAVYIEIEGRNLLFCFFMLYLFPVISFIVGIITGMIIAKILSYAKYQELFEIIFGFISFAISLLFVIWFDKKYKEKGIIKVSQMSQKYAGTDE